MDGTNRVELDRMEDFKAHVESLPDDMTLSQWLTALEMLQQVAYGAHYDEFSPDYRGDNILMNLYAMVCEVVEMGDEMGWKPWSYPRGWVNSDKVVMEAVDQMHFQGNLLKHANATGAQVGAELKRKMLKNLQRQIDGYDVRVEKCEWCHTDLGEHELTLYTIIRNGVEHKFCKQTHAEAWQTREDR